MLLPLRFQPGGPAGLSSPPLSTPLPVFSVQSFVAQGVCPARPSPSPENPRPDSPLRWVRVQLREPSQRHSYTGISGKSSLPGFH